MTISADYGPLIDSGNGVTVNFAVTFPFDEKSDLAVTLYDTVAGADVTPPPALNGIGLYDYTVSGTPDVSTGIYPSGAVVFNNAPLANHKVIRSRATPQRQPLALLDNARFPAKSVEGALDRLEMQIQEIDDVASRAITVPPGDTATDLVLPPVGERADRMFSFDGNGNVETPLDKNAVEAAVAAILSGVAPAPTTTAWAATLAIAKMLYPASLQLPDGQAIYVSGRTNSFDGYQGAFVYKAGDSSTVFPSDARGFVDNAGRRWWRWHPDGIVNVLWYGAWGDGFHNDHAPVQAAIDDVRGQSQTGVLMPRGVFLNDGPGAWNFSGVSVTGFSRIGTYLKRGPNLTDLYTWKLDDNTPGGGVEGTYSNFRTDGSRDINANPNWVIGILGNCLYNKFVNLDVMNFKTGAMRWVLQNGFRPNLNVVENCKFTDGDGDGVEMRCGGMITFRNFSVENIGGRFMNISSADESVGPLLVENFWFEKCGTGDGIVIDNYAGPLCFRHGRVQDYGNLAGTAGHGINLQKCQYGTFDAIIVSPHAGVSSANHRKFFISPNSGAIVIQNMSYSKADIEDLGGNTIYHNCALGRDRVIFTNGDAMAIGETRYYGPGTMPGSGFAGPRRMRWGGKDGIAGMWVDMGPLPGPGQNYKITLVVNATPIAASECTLVDGDNGVRGVDFTQPMNDIDTVEIRVVSSAGAAAIPIGQLKVTLLVFK